MAWEFRHALITRAVAVAAIGLIPEMGGAQPLSLEQERTLRPKDTFKECDACPEMVVVPMGSFMMGSPPNEPGRDNDEGPQQQVVFARPFAVGKFPVTFDEWDACASDGGCNGYRPSDERWGRGQRPVIHVSWTQAKAYVAWLSRKTGKTYRLLSESEREYVARAGTTTPYWWGSSVTPDQANFFYARRFRTLPVDSFQPNPWGLYQVHGNVWDWTEDCYHDSYAAAPTDGSAWTSGSCTFRVRRGGSWAGNAQSLRSATRDGNESFFVSSSVGFRVARTLIAP